MVKAIIQHETGSGTLGVGKTKNNLCGIKGKNGFMSYKTKEDGWDACADLYMRKYKHMSIYQMSRIWTATEQDSWYRNVTKFYQKFSKK